LTCEIGEKFWEEMSRNQGEDAKREIGACGEEGHPGKNKEVDKKKKIEKRGTAEKKKK